MGFQGLFCALWGHSLSTTIWKWALGEGKRGKKKKGEILEQHSRALFFRTAQLCPCFLFFICLNSHLSPDRFPTWAFAPVKSWGTLECGSWQTLPSCPSLMDQLEALTGEKPSCRNRKITPARTQPFPALENVSSSLCFIDREEKKTKPQKPLIICAVGHSKHISHRYNNNNKNLIYKQKRGWLKWEKKLKYNLRLLHSLGLVSSPRRELWWHFHCPCTVWNNELCVRQDAGLGFFSRCYFCKTSSSLFSTSCLLLSQPPKPQHLP